MAFDDDILIPPPRTAKAWRCTKCGQPGAVPEPGMLTVDPRYAFGHCPCTPGRKNRVSGYHRELISLIADFAWNPEKWQRDQERIAERKAYDKMMGGTSLKPEEARLAMRYKIRIETPDA